MAAKKADRVEMHHLMASLETQEGICVLHLWKAFEIKSNDTCLPMVYGTWFGGR